MGLRLDENPNRLLVAWTTTPWTLPSNLAICVHPDLEYVVAKGIRILKRRDQVIQFSDKNTNVEYVMLEVRLPELKNEDLEIIERVFLIYFICKYPRKVRTFLIQKRIKLSKIFRA